MRHLIYVPIVHSEVDLGSVAGEARQLFERAFGRTEWSRRRASVELMWEGLRARLLALPLCWHRTRLYQDGLPVCGREEEIVRELAADGSHNHRLLVELAANGATLMGTEDPELMLAEYRWIQKVREAAYGGASENGIEKVSREGRALLGARDDFVARRIDETLADGETGILFLGLLHRVDEIVDGRLELTLLIHTLPFDTDPWQRLKAKKRDH
jgi:hypothetical protein